MKDDAKIGQMRGSKKLSELFDDEFCPTRGSLWSFVLEPFVYKCIAANVTTSEKFLPDLHGTLVRL